MAVRFVGESGGWLALVPNSSNPIEIGVGRARPARNLMGAQGDKPPETQDVVPAPTAVLPAFR